ncbi:MAG: sulfatase, partial [Kiritimatiellales bacterium]|nr:sulfatase [Kiritimatiellales bacterium]
MKRISRAIVCGCLLIAGVASAKQPNVLFILADDLGIGGLHCYGTDWLETPNIDKLCKEGMHFSNGLAAYPTCRPSRAALLTGQYGPRTGVYRVKDSYGDEDKARLVIPKNLQLSPDKTTLGTAFKNAGYATAMYGKWHVSNEHQVHPGGHFGYDEAFVSAGAHYNAKSLPPVVLPAGMMIEELYSGKAAAFMEKSAKAGKPFFIYMPYFLVHGPAEARPDYIEHFKKKLKGIELEKGGKDIEVTAAMTRMLDDFVGMLLGKVKDLGIEKDTIVVFTSDNGSYDQNLVGGYRGRKGDTYDGGMRVPYIFKWPGKIKAGDVSTERIIGVDVYPTLLGLVGVEKPAGYPLDGVDLTPLLTGKTKALPSREIYCFYPKYVRFSEKTQRWAYSWRNVIYDGDFKLIEYPEYDEYELFNLADDPKEETDLAQSTPERRQALTAKLHRWLKDVGAPKLEPNPNYSLQQQPQENIKRRAPAKSVKPAKPAPTAPMPVKKGSRAKTIQFGGNILKVNPEHPVADSSTGWWGDWSLAVTKEKGSRRGKMEVGEWFADITGALSIRATAFADYAAGKPGTLAVKKSRLGVKDGGAAEVQPGEALVLEFNKAVRLRHLAFFGTPDAIEAKLTVAGIPVAISRLLPGQVYTFENPPLLHPGQTVVLESTDSYMLYSAVVEPAEESVLDAVPATAQKEKRKDPPPMKSAVVAKPGMTAAALQDENFEIQEFKVDKSTKLPTASDAAHEAWKNQRFGMFI